jgi:hypothetical protein
MTRTMHTISRTALAAFAGLACLVVSDDFSPTGSRPLLSEARAIIGRPLTPMSYAGVARRTTRRAYAYGAPAAYGAAVAAPYAYGAGCYQAVDAYGRVYTRCP